MNFLNSSTRGRVYRALLVPIVGGFSLLMSNYIQRLIQQMIPSAFDESVQSMMNLIIGILIGMALFCTGIFLHKRVTVSLKNRGANHAPIVDLLGAVLIGIGILLVLFTVF